MNKIGVIGGSGLEKLDIFTDRKEFQAENRFGVPSSTIFSGMIGDIDVFVLSRHGRDHSIPPAAVNNRANIFALKELGCSRILATTACGSLREEIKRGDIVIPDQFIDFTKHRINTFYDTFEPGQLGHASMADPFNASLRDQLIRAARALSLPVYDRGTLITIEGPRFSTRAESIMFRSWGADVINMSIAPEAALANEAGIPYAVIAMATDYDSWKTGEEPVSWENVLQVFSENVRNVTELIHEFLGKLT